MSGAVRVAYTILQCWHRVPGGTASSMLELAEALDRRDDVTLRGIGPAGTRLPDEPWTPPIPFSRVPVPYQLVYDIWQHTPFLSPANIRGGADVIHATAPTVPPTKGLPLVVTIHDVYPLLAPDQFTKRGVRILTRGIELARQRADVVCCPSENTAEDCIAAGFDPGRIRVVPWGARENRVDDAQRAAIRREFRLDRPFVLWVGTIEPRKNLPTLLDAFARIGRDDVDLVLVGPIGWHEQLEGHMAGIAPRVRQLGFLPDRVLGPLYAEAELFAMPSIREGFGLPVLDAMAHGCPVIVSGGTALEEVAGGAGVVVDPLDAQGWADALVAVLGDRTRREAMSEASAQRAAAFSWDDAAAQMAGIYRELAS